MTARPNNIDSPDADMVVSPPHYLLFPDQEAIHVIRAALTAEEYRGYLKRLGAQVPPAGR